ncbi:M3 family oligoendopeptidase [Faecalicoccus pleomorphus]|uniref:M3 family oligoendopeptidase n=1 Tax=Faecalicoccus pleomorphus TaxID=1323 RepID=UPI00232BF931|nr:M3 family oligoendopeptidase [Faecalicoccus pleomorphus]MDB7986656.1 M3 family oligoendopeptidase [Faecalicoccus pleomorphus]MDB7990603.1 M3 family oligoendopeptidase [Faecalicoccus pleomorphus]
MQFQEYAYQHMDALSLQKQLSELAEQIQQAKTIEQVQDCIKKVDTIRRFVATQVSLVEIRHTVDTKDAYYTKEQEYLDTVLPELEKDYEKINRALLESSFLEELKHRLPETFFLQKEMDLKAFDPIIIEDMQEENRLMTKYQALIASAEIPFDGEIYNLSSLEVKTNSSDRIVRKRALQAYWNWFEQHEEEVAQIFDQMIKVRTRMAQKLGYDNFIALGYARMHRYDYDQEDVAKYRRQVLKDVVPLCSALYKRQQKRLGYDTLHAWDEKVEFLQGNPTPKYDRAELVKRAQKMYHELSKETGVFFDFMVEHELLDLDSKPGKAAGGYCTFMPDYKSPFIFANFNQTQHDAEVLTHEAGHAYQIYESRDIYPSDCVWPTYESCEIHSMSMEFFTHPWMQSFFEEDVNRYYYSHMAGSLKFLPYGVLVDHFQYEVYTHPEMSHKERMDTWRRLEKEYLPHKNYEEVEILERGGWWMRQAHIFMSPFYYIDYTLAQVCAMQFWARMENKDPKAFEDYQHICKIGGTLPFRKIVKEAGLIVPFEEGCLAQVTGSVSQWLDEISEEELTA